MENAENVIKSLKQGIVNFFEGNLQELKSIHSLRAILGFYSLEMPELGASVINMKYGQKLPYIIASDKEGSDMVVLVCGWSALSKGDSIAMYCVRGDFVCEYQDEGGKNFFPIKKWKGKTGSNMILAAIKFHQGEISPSFVVAESGIGSDIVEYTRTLSLT